MRSASTFKNALILSAMFLLGSLFISGDILAYDFYDWYHGASGYEDALEEATGEEKPLIVYFHNEDCKWCKKLNSEYLASNEMSQFLTDIPKVEIGATKEAEGKALCEEYGVNRVPSFFVFIPALDTKPGERISPFLKGKPMTTNEFVDAIKKRITNTYNNKGYALFTNKQYGDVLKYCEISLNFDPENAYAYYSIGTVYHTIGYNQKDPDLLEKAKENYRMALKIDPNHEGSKKGLKNLHNNKNQ